MSITAPTSPASFDARVSVFEPWARVLRHRYTVLAAILVSSTVLAGGRGDWNVFVDAGRAMFGPDGVHVFVTHRDVQTGPLTLAAAWLLGTTPKNGFVLAVIAIGALGMATLRSIERMADGADG